MESTSMDPNESLELLRSSQRAAEIEGEIPHTPLWYAPALATCLGGFSLFDLGRGGSDWLFAAIAIVAAAIVSAHHFPNVKALPRRRSKQSVVSVVVIFAITWGLLTLWGVFTSTVEHEPARFGWWISVLALWVASTLALGGVMAAMNRQRQRLLDDQR